MKKSWVDSGRIETVVALAVLVTVIALFVKFYRPAAPDPQLPTIEAARTPAGPTSSAQPGS